MKHFGTVRQKLRRKIVIPPPLLSIKIFPYQKFSETQWFPGVVFSVLWAKKIFDKTLKLPPSFAWNFSIPEFFRNAEGFYEFYRRWETKIFQRSLVISPLWCIKFSETQIRRVPLRNFSALWNKKFSTENHDTLLHKVQKLVVELMFGKTLKTKFKTVALFLTVCKSWSKYL